MGEKRKFMGGQRPYNYMSHLGQAYKNCCDDTCLCRFNLRFTFGGFGLSIRYSSGTPGPNIPSCMSGWLSPNIKHCCFLSFVVSYEPNTIQITFINTIPTPLRYWCPHACLISNKHAKTEWSTNIIETGGVKVHTHHSLGLWLWGYR